MTDREPREDFSLDDEGGAWEGVSRWPARDRKASKTVRENSGGRKSIFTHLNEKRQGRG